jgi:hypothetical protein
VDIAMMDREVQVYYKRRLVSEQYLSYLD